MAHSTNLGMPRIGPGRELKKATEAYWRGDVGACRQIALALHDEVADLEELTSSAYARAVGPGVYDVHSPRVPHEAEIAALVGKAVSVVGGDRVWVNPDCGLKTRRWEEVRPAMVAAARSVRSSGASDQSRAVREQK